MAAQVQKSGFLAKLGNRLDAAVREHADDDVDFGFRRLPPGIKNGVAKLVECGFFQYAPDTNQKQADGRSAAGEWFFRAAGVVVSPKSVATPDGVVPVEGLQTSVMVPLIDTKNASGEVTTAVEHATSSRTNVLNELKKLGATINPKGGTAQLEPLAAALKKQAPYFRFSTSGGKADPNRVNPATGQPYEPRTWENWDGVLEGYEPREDDEAVDDDTVAHPPGASANGVPRAGRKTAADPAPDDGGYTDTDDVESLVERAEADDGDAQARLKELAMAAGHGEGACDATESWRELADLAGSEPEPGSGEDDAGEWVPQKGEVYPVKVKTWDAKTKKMVAAKKPVDCEVTGVHEATQTVTIKSLVTGKVVTGSDGKAQKIGWDELVRE